MNRLQREPICANGRRHSVLANAAKSQRKDDRQQCSALNSKVWAPLFEGYDPGATKLNLEVRHPFIDVRLVEYLLAIPAARGA